MKIPQFPTSTFPRKKVIIPLLGFIILTGGAPVAIRITYTELAPFWMGFIRFGMAAIAFWILTFTRHLRVPKGRALLGAVLYGILGIGVPFVLFAWGLVKTSASLASILLATMPLVTIFLSAYECVETLTMSGLFGSLLAISGTIFIVGGSGSTDISLPHIGAIIIGVVITAQSGVLVKRYPANPPIITNAIALTIGAIILAIASILVKEAWVVPVMTSTWIALSYLVILVTIVAFIFFLQVLNNWTASGTSYSFVIIPLVTVIISAVLINEKFSANFIIGGSLVLIGVMVGSLMPGKKHNNSIILRPCN